MRKVFLYALFASTMALSGCGDGPPIEVTIGCGGNVGGGVVGCDVTWKASTEMDGGFIFDASQARINLSQSNISLVSSSGTFLVKVKNSFGNIVATRVFNWYKSGGYIFPANPSQINNWIELNVASGETVEVDFSGITMSQKPGNNTVVVILEYGPISIGGSDSFYLNEADLNGF